MTLISNSPPTLGEPVSTGDTKYINLLTEIKNALNGALDATNMADAFATDVVEPAFSTWKPLADVSGQFSGAKSTTVVMGRGTNSDVGTFAYAYLFILPLSASDLTAGSRTTQFRIVTDIIPTGSAPGVTFTIALYNPTITKPATNDPPYISALGSATSGSSKTSGTLSTTGAVTVTGDAFTAPATNLYAIAVTPSGSTANNAATSFICRLQYRQT